MSGSLMALLGLLSRSYEHMHKMEYGVWCGFWEYQSLLAMDVLVSFRFHVQLCYSKVQCHRRWLSDALTDLSILTPDFNLTFSLANLVQQHYNDSAHNEGPKL